MATKIGPTTWLDESTWSSPNFTPAASVPAVYGQPRKITGVTVHHWGVDGQRYETVANFLSRPNGNTSAHFVVEAGRAACLISPANAAWHAGSAAGNATTIGIECRPEMTAGDVASLVELIAWLEGVYGPLKVYGHKDWHNTACPGRYYPRLGEIINRVNALESGKAPAAPAQPSKPAAKSGPDTSGPYWTVEKGDTLGKIAAYYGIPEKVKQIAAYNSVDPRKLKVGQRIYIPGPLVWTVDPGDTWDKIDAYYGYSRGAVASRNPGARLTPGTVLKVWG